MNDSGNPYHLTFHASRIKIKRGQVILRHTELTAYRCFLPDLAGFTGFCCTGPSPFFKVLSCELKERLIGCEADFLPHSCSANSTLSTHNSARL